MLEIIGRRMIAPPGKAGAIQRVDVREKLSSPKRCNKYGQRRRRFGPKSVAATPTSWIRHIVRAPNRARSARHMEVRS
jgi:hypothetical protein